MKSRILAICVSLLVVGTLIASPAYATGASAVSYKVTSIDANLNAAATPDHIVLSWAGDPTTSQTITWRTISTDTKGKVQYRVKGTPTWTTGPNVSPKLLTSGTGNVSITTGTENIFSTTITGLASGTIYEYRVIGVDTSANDNTSGINYFTTEKVSNASTKFIIFGDSQSGMANNPDYTPWNNTVQEAYKQNKDANFIVNMGDLVEVGQNYQHWNNWFSAAQGVIDNIPEMPVQGNHETYQSNNFNSASPQDFINQFSVPQNGPNGHVGQAYSYNYGNAHFVVLDSQEEEEAAGDDSFLQQQAVWLDNDLTNNTQKWTIVMFHKTPYYNRETRSNPVVKDIFTPVIEKHHVDVVFNGHDHCISRSYAINGDNYYTDYSKGTVYYVAGISGNKYYTDVNSKIWDAAFYDCKDSPAYEVVSIVNGRLTIESYKYNTIDTSTRNKKNRIYNTSTKIDSFTIDKDNPEASTQLKLIASPNIQLAISGTIQKEYKVTLSDKKAYIDPKLLANYYGGTYDAKSLTLTIDGQAYKFKEADLLKGDSTKVNADAFYRQGIDVNYNTALNCILVDLTGRITPDMIAAFKGFVIDTAANTTGTTGQAKYLEALVVLGLLLIIAGGVAIVMKKRRIKY